MFHRAKDTLIEMFAKFVEEEYSLGQLNFFLDCRRQVLDTFHVLTRQKELAVHPEVVLVDVALGTPSPWLHKSLEPSRY